MPDQPGHPGDIQQYREEWLSKARREWYAVMRPLGTWVPPDLTDLVLDERDVPDYFRSASELDWGHLRDCRVVPSRVELVRECLPKRGVVAEVGTDHGAFAEIILKYAVPSELHVIDISLANFRRDVFAPAIQAGTVRLHESDSVEALRRFPDEYFDWIYIDANHSYEGVTRDLNEAKRAVKRQGLLVVNDYVFWSHREFMAYGVVQAVNELCRSEDWKLLYLALHPEMHCDVVLRR
jgi:hypothetical protein